MIELRTPDDHAMYNELRGFARWQLRDLNHITLSATDLVHEAVVRVMKQDATPEDEELRAVVSLMIRRVLSNHLRSRLASKRDARLTIRLQNTEAIASGNAAEFDFLEFDDAMEKLRRLSAEQVQILELKFFGGLSNAQIARYTGVALRSVQQQSQHARAWLMRELYSDRPTTRI